MKRLIVLRHAKSSWHDESLTDHDRPLSNRGDHDAPRMAARIGRRGVHAALILTSTARRALDTATILAGALGDAAILQPDPDLYLASPGTLLAILAAQPAAEATIVLVGHNPGLTQLVNMLLPDMRLANLPTAGVVSMQVDIDNWADIGTVAGTTEYFDYPKNPSEV